MVRPTCIALIAALIAIPAAGRDNAMRGHLAALSARLPVVPVTSGLQLWLDGADTATMYDATSGGNLVAANGLIARWEDKSGNARHATQATSDTRPTRTDNILNGRTVARLTADWMSIPSSTATFKFLHDGTSATIYAVNKMGAVADPDAMYAIIGNDGTSTLNVGLNIRYDDRSSVPRNNAIASFISRGESGTHASLFAANDVWTANTHVLMRIRIDADNATADDRMRYRFGTAAEAGGNVATSAPSTANATYNLHIGQAGNDAQIMTGDLAEVLIYNRDLTEAERTSVESYLNAKWGL